MTCDASDGACRCAGRTVCGGNEVCDPVAQACVTTDRCAAVTCPAGLSCDPADGNCKCGGIAMAAFGSGPIRGFGITLIIGILTSMFTAVSVSRAIATLIYGRRRKLKTVSV